MMNFEISLINLIPNCITQMVWIETPTNPLLKLVDIQGAADLVHQHKVCLVEDSLYDQVRNSHILDLPMTNS